MHAGFLTKTDDARVAMTLNNLGAARFETGETKRRWNTVVERLAFARHLGLPRDTGSALNNLAHIVYHHGDLQKASALAEEGLALHQTLGDEWYRADDLALLGALSLDKGDVALAEALQEGPWKCARGLDIARASHTRCSNADTSGHIACAHQDWRRAIDHYCEAFAVYRAVESAVGVATCLEVLAGTLLDLSGGQHIEQALRLCGFAVQVRQGTQTMRAPYEAAGYERVLLVSQALLDAKGVAADWATPVQGTVVNMRELLALAQSTIWELAELYSPTDSCG